jgi:alkylation response protein AidB-like acyl-CoA dehydrogenase
MSQGNVLKPDHAASRRSFIFEDEHEQLRETIESFARSELAPHADEWERTTFPDSVFLRMGELGFLGLDKPEKYGGQGGDYFAAIVLAEALVQAESAGLALAVAVQTDMTMPPILAFGSEQQKRSWLAPAIAGEKILALGITEPDAGSDVAGIRTRARPEGEEFVINGSKTYITNGRRADGIVLLTRTDPDAGYDGFTVFLVPLDADGVTRERTLEKLGNHSSDTAQLAFEDVRVPRDAVLGEVGKGFYNIMWELQGERLIGAAGAVASAQLAFDKTVAYAKERRAFGRAIGNFQAIRHRFAEMSAKIEAARALVHTTAWRFKNGDYPVREISAAKLVACRTNIEICDECIQIHGGAGYMREYGIERMWRDARLGRIGAGTDEVLLEVIGRSYGL